MENKEGAHQPDYPKNPYRALREWIEATAVDALTRENIWEKAKGSRRIPDEVDIRHDLEEIALYLDQYGDHERSRAVFYAIGKE